MCDGNDGHLVIGCTGQEMDGAEQSEIVCLGEIIRPPTREGQI